MVKPFPRIPRVRVRVRVRVRLDQPAIQVSSRSFGMADLRIGGPKSMLYSQYECIVSIMSIGTKPHFKREAVRDTVGIGTRE